MARGELGAPQTLNFQTSFVPAGVCLPRLGGWQQSLHCLGRVGTSEVRGFLAFWEWVGTDPTGRKVKASRRESISKTLGVVGWKSAGPSP